MYVFMCAYEHTVIIAGKSQTSCLLHKRFIIHINFFGIPQSLRAAASQNQFKRIYCNLVYIYNTCVYVYRYVCMSLHMLAVSFLY